MITVLVNCRECKTEKEKVTVRSRYVGEDIKSYIEEIGRRVYDDHRGRHSHCNALVDVLIPSSGKGVGRT